MPQAAEDLNKLTAMAVGIVNQVEDRLYPAPDAAPAQANPSRNAPSKVIEGELVDHGAARYQHKDDKQMSYFVILKTDKGERTLWGVGLDDAMNDSDLRPGDPMRLEDLGTRPVVVQEIAEDGTIKEKTTNRREWSAEPAAPVREVADTTPKGLAVAAGTPELDEPEQEAGMGMD